MNVFCVNLAVITDTRCLHAGKMDSRRGEGGRLCLYGQKHINVQGLVLPFDF